MLDSCQANSFVKQLHSSRVVSPMVIQYISILENLCRSVSLSQQQRGSLYWPFLYQAMYWCEVGLKIWAKRHPRVPKLPVTRGESLPNLQVTHKHIYLSHIPVSSSRITLTHHASQGSILDNCKRPAKLVQENIQTRSSLKLSEIAFVGVTMI